MSRDEGNQYISDGLGEEIINDSGYALPHSVLGCCSAYKNLFRRSESSLATYYGAKYPNRSRTKYVLPAANTLICVSPPGAIAMLAVICPFNAFNVEASGCTAPSAHNVRYPSSGSGTTVALNKYAATALVPPHPLPWTLTLIVPSNGGAPDGFRVSNTRHGGSA